MITDETRSCVKQITENSWTLLAFEHLRSNASAATQIQALKSDQQWIRDHMEEICSRIDHVIMKLEESTSG